MDRVILHCDMNSFYASIELLDHPEYRNVPMAVSGDPASRHGIILAKNEPAKKYGIRTAETVWQAKRKCPNLVLLPPHREKYRDYHQRINAIFLDYTELVEPFSIDESWLDVTGSRKLFGSGKEIADTIRRRVRDELGLTLSAGVSFNKIFAKMGSEYRKPDATTVISRENYQAVLWPLPVSDFFFVGRATASRLSGIGIETIGDLAEAEESVLIRLLGKQGSKLRQAARGEDETPVRRYDEKRQAKSVGNGVTFPRDLTEEDDILAAITSLSDTVSARLRKAGLRAGGVKVDIKDPSLVTISRQMKLDDPTDRAADIIRAAMDLIRGTVAPGSPIRLLTVTAIHLEEKNAPRQLNLFGALSSRAPETAGASGQAEDRTMEYTMDEIRRKFGRDAIGFASSSKRKQD
ncbi:DNA polymerase IV [Eubacterium pyruvativorans]|uniref:DNA polymerase IV n=1 Tax=Eubacterium pyruvativorans TaxID=155865 RepID=UPI00088D50D5|nr:DNA polymerase IV [Eubacterium pyruvativorans]MDD6708276.1 DNA polymerase IV [Eubacterium pyruvativorans]MDY4049121.1 DNA polymerase IV [Eubacterium pyruvativorans]SDF02071.1 DNA polymerase-4 [Eubacterium pyruvativorans]